MTQADTPDYQRGVISAQKLLGTIAAGSTAATVGVPPNAETIVCMIQNQASSEGAYCEGVTTGLIYPSGAIVLTQGATSTITVWFDVSAAVDDQVTINLFTAAAGTTYIYSDSAVHTTNDPVTVDVLHGAMDGKNDAMYVIPRAPATDAGDHPPVELSMNTVTQAAPLPAPGAGLRYRLFAIYPNPQAAGDAFYLTLNPAHGGGSGNYFGFGGATAAYVRAPIVFPLSGLPLITNSGVWLTDVTGTNDATVLYTTETA